MVSLVISTSLENKNPTIITASVDQLLQKMCYYYDIIACDSHNVRGSIMSPILQKSKMDTNHLYLFSIFSNLVKNRFYFLRCIILCM